MKHSTSSRMALYGLFRTFCFVMVLFDRYSVDGLVSQSKSNFCSVSYKRRRCRTQLQQQKKRPPIGGDFIELGSSLITLLNLAQEIGSSNNLRFRQAADKLRDQFARSFALRYDLEKSQFLSAALSSIDGDTQLTTGRKINCVKFTSTLIRILIISICCCAVCVCVGYVLYPFFIVFNRTLHSINCTIISISSILDILIGFEIQVFAFQFIDFFISLLR